MDAFFVDPVLHVGREGEKSGPGSKQRAVYDLLDKLEIAYMRADHTHADTIADCAEIEKLLSAPVCKNLFLCNRQATAFYLLVMPGDKPFRTAVVSKLLGTARLSFAQPEYLEKYLGLTPGSVSIFGLMHDVSHAVTLLIDRETAQTPFLGFHPCVNTSTLRVAAQDLFDRFLPCTGHTPIILDIPREE